MIPLVLLVIAFAAIIYGAIVLKWGMSHMAAIFLTYTVVADLIIGTEASKCSEQPLLLGWQQLSVVL